MTCQTHQVGANSIASGSCESLDSWIISPLSDSPASNVRGGFTLDPRHKDDLIHYSEKASATRYHNKSHQSEDGKEMEVHK